MQKKIFVVLFALLLLVGSIVPAYAVEPTISVGKINATPGETVTVPVSISGNPEINTFSLGFSYDSSKITLLDVTVSSKIGGQFTYKEKAVWLNSKDVKYNGEILYLKFKVAENAESGDTRVSVTYSPGDISNYNEDDVIFKISPGEVSIEPTQQPIKSIKAFFRYVIEIIKRFFKIKL